jgi:Trk K+ transport system NAD-binding subunit
MNIYLSVYCRRLNPEARILTRITHERNIEAIRRAGADFVLSYASFGVQTVFSIVRGREIVVLGEDVNLFYVRLPPSLANKTLAEAEIGARTGLNVIGIQRNGRRGDPAGTRPTAPSRRLRARGDREHRAAHALQGALRLRAERRSKASTLAPQDSPSALPIQCRGRESNPHALADSGF